MVREYNENIVLPPEEDCVIIIDQTRLPGELVYIRLETLEQMVDAIVKLQVRGAPAIGICAAYCLYVLARQSRELCRRDFSKKACICRENRNR